MTGKHGAVDKPMHPKNSFHQYPRPDNVYEHKQSFNFDMMRTRIFLNRRKTYTDAYLWVAHGFVGVIMATITWTMTILEDHSAEFKSDFVQKIIDRSDSAAAAWAAYTIYGMSFVLFACLMTIYIGPGANGSGVAEIMGMLNGINYPKAIAVRTLITKCVGTVFAVSGGLTIGKEGPLAHIGANVGALVCHLPIKGFYTLRNDVIKRQMIAAGASAGVSTAFGAPIGGALFSYEISKPNTFWTFSMLWRVFAACSIATFLLGIYSSLWSGKTFSVDDTGALKFGNLSDKESSLLDLPAAIIIGIVCALLGSFFIFVNINLGILRKKYITKNWQKISEALFFAFISSSLFFLVVIARQDTCRAPAEGAPEINLIKFRCKNDDFNPLATLIFNTEGGTIRALMAYPLELQDDQSKSIVPVADIVIYFAVWYCLTIITYGVWVPAGLFLPGILIGCSVGIIYMDILVYGFGANILEIGGQSYIIIGATAMLASYCRLTYSLAVIMLETTQSINNFLPTVLTIAVALSVSKSINRSLYDYAIRMKQMPLLRNHMPAQNCNIRVKEVLEKNPQQIEVVESVCQVDRLVQVSQLSFSSIPVVNMAGRIIGMIPRNFVIVLIENHCWYDETKIQAKNRASGAVSMYYHSAMKRQASERLSEQSNSPRGSHNDVKDDYFDCDQVVSPKKAVKIDAEEGGVIKDSDKSLNKGTDSSENAVPEAMHYSADSQNISKFLPQEADDRNQTMMGYTGERDYELAPKSENLLHWHKFVSDFYSTERSIEEVADIYNQFGHKYVDLRPYMIEQPYMVLTTDKLPKCLELFRHMHLRALPVADPNSGMPVAILTRQDIFSYMSL